MAVSKDSPAYSAEVEGHDARPAKEVAVVGKDEESRTAGTAEEDEEPVVTLKTWVVVMVCLPRRCEISIHTA